jgi:hypothetical protein
MIGLVFLVCFYILRFPNQFAVCGPSFWEIILLNCLTYEFLAGSWNFWNWHSNIHRGDVEILHVHEIIFSTIDKPKLLAQVRLRTPIKKGCTQCRRLLALCGVWWRVSLSAKPYPHNMQRLALEPGTFRLQTVGSTAAPGPDLEHQSLCYLCSFHLDLRLMTYQVP